MKKEMFERLIGRAAQTRTGKRITEVLDLIAADKLRRRARDSVRQLRSTPWLVVCTTTGARGDLGKLLWQPPGASTNILTDAFTYAQEATAKYIGFRPAKFVTDEVACHMATTAYYEGRRLAVERGKNENDVMGVGMTSAVTTDRERRGADEVIVAVRTRDSLWTGRVLLKKPANFARDAEDHRAVQGELADLITLNAILYVAHIQQVPLSLAWVEHAENDAVFPSGEESSYVLLLKRTSLWRGPDQTPIYGKVIMPDGSMCDIKDLDPAKWIVFPGSFDPVTYAHDEMAKAIERTTGKRVLFQITKAHPVKSVTDQNMVDRAGQFLYRWPIVLLEGDGLFTQKAERFPGMEMLVGADVVNDRMFDAGFYGGDDAMDAAFERMRSLGTVFHVNGRVCGDRRYRELADIRIASRFAGMFRPFSHRNDVSSSERRAAGAKVSS